MKLALAAILALTSLVASADGNNNFVKNKFAQIDKTKEVCLDNPDNQNTVGINMCVGEAFESGDKFLNQIYKDIVVLNTTKDDDSKEILKRLKAAQRTWITFRDTNSKMHGVYMLGGSGETAVIVGTAYQMTKERALELYELFLREQ